MGDLWAYDPALNMWEQKADFGGVARVAAVGFSIGANGYIGLGANGIGFYVSDFWEYDPALDSWTEKASFTGEPRIQAVGFSIDGTGYLGTGDIGIDEYTNDFWAYDPALDSWTQQADFGGAARVHAVGFSIGPKGYIGTGYSGEFASDFWEYNPANDTWTEKAGFGGAARWGAVGFSTGTKGYIGTGGAAGAQIKSDFWEYAPEDIGTSIHQDAITVIGQAGPNPTREASVITWAVNSPKSCRLSLSNATGQMLVTTMVPMSAPYRLELSQYAPGPYLVRLAMADGTTQELRIEKVE